MTSPMPGLAHRQAECVRAAGQSSPGRAMWWLGSEAAEDAPAGRRWRCRARGIAERWTVIRSQGVAVAGRARRALGEQLEDAVLEHADLAMAGGARRVRADPGAGAERLDMSGALPDRRADLEAEALEGGVDAAADGGAPVDPARHQHAGG